MRETDVIHSCLRTELEFRFCNAWHCTLCTILCYAQLLQSCPALCDSMDSSPPGSSVHDILQARMLEWVIMPYSRGSSRPRYQTWVSCISCIASGSFSSEPLGKAPSLYHPTWLVLCLRLPESCLGSGNPKSKLLMMQSSISHWASPVAQTVKNSPAIRETWVWSLGREDPLEKGMATHSSILAWRIPWTEEPGGLQSMGSQRVRHD